MKFVAIDRLNKRYGHLLVIERAENIKGKPAWVCKCDCGNIVTVSSRNLSRGTYSCGCMLRGKPLIYRRSHANKLYNQWIGMIYRCTHEKASHFDRYGARGITVCKEWQTDFEAFVKWSLKNGYKNNLEIDRIDNNLEYSPDNCRWVSHVENSRNRNNRCTNKCGVAGVYYRADCNKWRANITVDYHRINLGTFDTLEEAAAARKEAEKTYWGKL